MILFLVIDECEKFSTFILVVCRLKSKRFCSNSFAWNPGSQFFPQLVIFKWWCPGVPKTLCLEMLGSRIFEKFSITWLLFLMATRNPPSTSWGTGSEHLPLFTTGFSHPNGGWPWDFWNIKCMTVWPCSTFCLPKGSKDFFYGQYEELMEPVVAEAAAAIAESQRERSNESLAWRQEHFSYESGLKKHLQSTPGSRDSAEQCPPPAFWRRTKFLPAIEIQGCPCEAIYLKASNNYYKFHQGSKQASIDSFLGWVGGSIGDTSLEVLFSESPWKI